MVINNNHIYIIDFDKCNLTDPIDDFKPFCWSVRENVYFDEEHNLCTTHDNLPYQVCETFPWAGEYGLNLNINCLKLQKALIFYFDYIFEKMQKELQDDI